MSEVAWAYKISLKMLDVHWCHASPYMDVGNKVLKGPTQVMLQHNR